jgi:hypothetical protein
MNDPEVKNRLRQDIRKKITTTMIAALDAFEKEFGRLWGIDKSEGYTEREEKFYEKWLSVRERILDKGNAQIAAASSNLDKYDVAETRYSVKFINRRNDGRD